MSAIENEQVKDVGEPSERDLEVSSFLFFNPISLELAPFAKANDNDLVLSFNQVNWVFNVRMYLNIALPTSL